MQRTEGLRRTTTVTVGIAAASLAGVIVVAGLADHHASTATTPPTDTPTTSSTSPTSATPTSGDNTSITSGTGGGVATSGGS